MNTAEMWLAAQKDGKIYKACDMRYSQNKGFYGCSQQEAWAPDAFSSIEDIMNLNWTEAREMTKAEAAKALGVDIID